MNQPIPRRRAGRHTGRRKSLPLGIERLEARRLMANDFANSMLSDQAKWFAHYDQVERIAFTRLNHVDQTLPLGVAGPQAPAVGEWIVTLQPETSSAVKELRELDAFLSRDGVSIQVIAGLGQPGLVLVRGVGHSKLDIESAFASNDSVRSFHLNQLIEGQATNPNDPDFVAGVQSNLSLIGASQAWDTSIGNMSTVVGVVDTGIDPKHPDLYLNIWLNQGELPPKFLDSDGNRLQDIDQDGLITFYDLNHATRSTTAPYSLTVAGFANGPNAEFVKDLNKNTRIDAEDLLLDANWADGRDTDGNGFFDDLFGVNFRTGVNDPFASNNPSDPLGHGTHVAGTIGAIGGNGTGVAGVNWQTSLMSLRILDNNNQGDTGAAIRAINYATMMRSQMDTDSANRLVRGANVRVLNNSWGQPGGFEASLEASIQAASDEGMMFVAAAGNGNVIGQGVDNDRTPFYPASYLADNVIAVAASDGSDRLATFSNYGNDSVDLVAPGVGVLSTVPGGSYQTANGTSMATPHVSGAAALIWSQNPAATVTEVRSALLSTVLPVSSLNGFVETAGRLRLSNAMNADVFAPAAQIVSLQNISTAGGATNEVTVKYSHRTGINTASIGDDDLLVTRQWGPQSTVPLRLKPNSITQTATSATATYLVDAPGGSWDALDFGEYQITTQAGKVAAGSPSKFVEAREIGSFQVKINDPSVLYVSTFSDLSGQGSLRDAINAANAAGQPRTILLDTGTYDLSIPHQQDVTSTFPNGLNSCVSFFGTTTGWSNPQTGDLDVTGSITILGNQNDLTVIDANAVDRVFKVHPGGQLTLQRVTVTGGVGPKDQGGGGILMAGTNLTIRDSIVRGNLSKNSEGSTEAYGGGISVWAGDLQLERSWVDENESNAGGGVFFCGLATGAVKQSTISNNRGGGLLSQTKKDIPVTDSTFSANSGSLGALATRRIDNQSSNKPAISGDGRYVVFASSVDDLIPNDTNRNTDIFLYDHVTATLERVSVASDGSQANGFSGNPAISSDGRYISYESSATNLVSGDTNGRSDVFVYDRIAKSVERVSVSNAGVQGNDQSNGASLSADGRYVAYLSLANNLVTGDSTTGFFDIFVFDRVSRTTERVSLSSSGVQADRSSVNPRLSADGRFVVFTSFATNLVANDTNSDTDVFVYDRNTDTIEQVSVSTAGVKGNAGSSTASISADGRYVTYDSLASNLVTGDTNGQQDVFLFDRTAKTTQRISLGPSGAQPIRGAYDPIISSDGRYIWFRSDSNGDLNLFGSNFDFSVNNYRYDRVNQTLNVMGLFGDSIAVNASGTQAAFVSEVPFIRTTHVSTYNAITSQTIAISSQPLNRILAKHLTVTATTNASTAVTGQIDLQNSILFNPIVDTQNTVTQTNNLQQPTAGVGLISQLTRSGHSPPVHYLLSGNPGINQATVSSIGTTDQLGRVRLTPDIGAVETLDASISGVAFLDYDRDQIRDSNEPVLSNKFITVEVGGQVFQSRTNDQGEYRFDAIPPGITFTSIEVPANFELSLSGAMTIPPGQLPNGAISVGAFSADGGLVFFNTNASNLIVGDTNNATDVFVYNTVTQALNRVTKSAAGVEANKGGLTSSVSADGRYVAFTSESTNLGPAVSSPFTQLYVLDRQTNAIEAVSVSNNGTIGNSFANEHRLSSDGRYVVYTSRSSNLVPGDTSDLYEDIFVFDRQTRTVERVSISNTGAEANSDSIGPNISNDGRYVSFISYADNLVPGDTNGTPDIFIYDRTLDQIKRINLSLSGNQTIGINASVPSATPDGRFIAFDSTATGLVTGDTNNKYDVFVYDAVTGLIERVSIGSDGAEGNQASTNPQISSDGRFVVFESSATNFDPQASDGFLNSYVYDRTTDTLSLLQPTVGASSTPTRLSQPKISPDGQYIASSNILLRNPLYNPGKIQRTFIAGEQVTNFNIGLIPDSGSIRGRVFNDSQVPNGVYDLGETVIAESVVFLDSNGNEVFDNNELSARTDSEGKYQFTSLQSETNYQVRLLPSTGFELVSPGSTTDFAHRIYVSAGASVVNRDFALQPIQTTGQSSSSSVSGRFYEDRNGNGAYDAGVDLPIVGREVYLDATNFGFRDENEPREVTDATGSYQFTGLSPRNVAVTAKSDPNYVNVTPLGSRFSPTIHPLFPNLEPFGNAQAVGTGDFNSDGFLDVAVILAEGNRLSIRLNDQAGGFRADQINIDLGQAGSGPTSLVIGQFDNNSQLDVALTASLAGNLVILRNFQPQSASFESRTNLSTGTQPVDLAIGKFNADAFDDLVVLNRGSSSLNNDETVVMFLNNGSGTFTPGTPRSTGGRDSASITVGEFTGDTALDVAVIHAQPNSSTTAFGGATILAGNGAGSVAFNGRYYTLGATPLDSATADFNADGKADLAVTNFASNSISVLLGQASGIMKVQSSILGTASGAVDLAVGDIDNDGDVDIIASNLRDKSFAIFRNIGVDGTTGDVRFEPLENIGLAQLAFAQRMPLTLANFDNDRSGPSGTGTLDIISAPFFATSVYLLKNTLVDGARRVALTGLNAAIGQDFIVKPAILPPALDAIANPLPILEDSGLQPLSLTGIKRGRPGVTPLKFAVTSSRNDLLNLAANAVEYVEGNNSATLRYSPLPNANGQTIVTVTVTDPGADLTIGNADDVSVSRSFTVTVVPVNDPPSFTLPANRAVTVVEDSGLTQIAAFVTNVQAGPPSADEIAQTLTPFQLTTDHPEFFSSQPTLNAQGALSFTPVANANGQAIVTVKLSDNGGQSDGGIDSRTEVFVITIQPVNDPPDFVILGNRTLNANSPAQTIPGFASGFTPGGGIDEATQQVSDYQLVNDNPGLFLVPPALATDGTLTFTPSGNVGVSQVSVRVRDSGGRLNGGNDLSNAKSFSISLLPENDANPPAPTLTTSTTSLSNQRVFGVQIDFGESVNGFTLSDLIVTGGSVSQLQSQPNGRYSATFSATADGPITIGLPAGVAQDLAGNANLAAATVRVDIDSVGVTPTITTTAPAITNLSVIPISVSFGERVSGLTIEDFSVIGGAASGLVEVDAALGTYRFNLTPAQDGPVSVLLAAGAVQDVYGNLNLASNILSRVVDRTPPQVSLSATVPSVTSNTVFDILVDFSEPVTGFELTDVTINQGSLNNFRTLSPTRYAATVNANNGAISIGLPAAAAVDPAGNTSAAASPLNLTIDQALIVPTLSTNEPNPTRNSSFLVNVTFGKAVNDFALNDIVITGGTASNLSLLDAASGRYQFTFSASADGQLTAFIAADAVRDTAGNRSLASNTLSRVLDRQAPSVTLTSSVATFTNQASFPIEVDFAETVVGFALSDMVVSGGSLSDLRDLQSGRYSALFTASRDGEIRIDLPAGQAQDLAGNVNSSASTLLRTIDTQGLTPVLSSSAGSLSNLSRLPVVIEFGEITQNFSLSDILVLGGSATNLSEIDASRGRYSFDVNVSDDGAISIVVPGASAQDKFGNQNLASNVLTRFIDRVGPQATLSTNVPATSSLSTFDVFVDFTEPVTGFELTDVTINQGTVSGLRVLSPTRYAFTVNASNGSITLGLPAGIAQDVAGNVNSAAASLNVAIDQSALVPALSTTASDPTNANAVVVTANFGKPVRDFTLSDITVLGGTAGQFTETDSQRGIFSFQVTPASDGTVTVLVPAGVASDTAGNVNQSSNLLRLTVDRQSPLPTLTTNLAAIFNQRVFVFQIDFGESVNGFTLSDLIVTGGSVSQLQNQPNGRYIATFTATTDGPITIGLPAGVAQDLAGNANLAAATVRIDIDSVGVTPTITTTAPATTNLSVIPISVSFGERVSGLVLEDFSVIGGAASGLVEADAALGSYRFNVTPAQDGPVSVLLAAGAVQDVYGNLNLASNILSRVVDRTPPQVSLSATVPSVTSSTVFDILVDFSEPVTGFELTDVTINQGTLSGLRVLSPTRYAFTVNASNGSITLGLPAGIAQDVAGNVNSAAASLSVAIDQSALVPALSTTASDPTNANAVVVTANFGKPVRDFTLSDITVLGGTAGQFTETDSQRGIFSFQVTPASDGTVTVLVPAGVTSDTAGNVNQSSNLLRLTVDRQSPLPTLTTNLAAIFNQRVFVFQIDFGESVNSFTLSDLIVTGGSVSQLQSQPNGRYSATFTATADSPISIGLPAGVAQDLAGNANLAAATVRIDIDSVGVTPAITTTAPAITNLSVIPISVSFGERVSGLAIEDFSVIGGAASGLVEVDAALGSYRFNVTPAQDGPVSVLLAAGAVQDVYGNLNLASNILSRVVDRTPPQVSLSATVPSVTSSTVFDILVDFSEPVTGFQLTDVTINQGTLSGLRVLSPTRYAFTVNASNGSITLGLPAGIAQDVAGNVNSAAASLNVAIDQSALVPALSTTASDPTNANAVVVTANFGKPVRDFTLSDITVLGGTAGQFTETDSQRGIFSFQVTPASDGTVTVLVPAGVASDTAGNLNQSSNLLRLTVDRQSPKAILATGVSNIVNTRTFDFEIDFGETVSGLTIDDFSVSGGSLSDLRSKPVGGFLVTFTAAADGPISIGLPAAKVVDIAGNASLASEAITRVIDTVSPKPIITTSVVSPTSNPQISIQIGFGEDVNGFAANDLILVNATVESLAETSPGNFTLLLKAIEDGLIVIGLSNASATDAAGNSAIGVAPLLLTLDRSPTTYSPVVSSIESFPTTNRDFDVVIEFGREVRGLTSDDFTVTNLSILDVTEIALGRYQAKVRALTEGSFSLALGAAKVVDGQNLPNNASNSLTGSFIDITNSDFGDAPSASQSGFAASYPVRIADNGARHKISSLFLGTNVDAESDGQPSANATGDDPAASAARGVELLIKPLAAVSETFSLVRVTSSGVGKLDGWIDFNHDGDWNDAGEQISNSQSIVAGSQLVLITIPARSLPGVTYARFRLSTAGGLSPLGPASDGEVEDYAIELANGNGSTDLTIPAEQIASGEIIVNEGQLIVREGTTDYFRSTAAAVRNILVTKGAETVLRLKDLGAGLPGTIRYSIASGQFDASVIVSTNELDLGESSVQRLEGIDVIDLSSGPVKLTLTAADISRLNPSQTVKIIAGVDDRILADGEWKLTSTAIIDGRYVPTFLNQASQIQFFHVPEWQNPFNFFDVTGDGKVTSLDALGVINALNAGNLTDAQGAFLSANQLGLGAYQFLDVDGDGKLAPLDALAIINELNRAASSGEYTVPRDDEQEREMLIDRIMHEWDEV